MEADLHEHIHLENNILTRISHNAPAADAAGH
jgi:iron-sulfur cluster repair protein YtfE (RIC family)